MGSASMIVREVVTPTSPAEVPPASAARGGVSTLVATTGGEVALLSTTPHSGVAVLASSASASPMTRSSGDLVREGEDGAPRPPCGLVTGLHGKIPRKNRNLQDTKYKTQPAIKTLPRHGGNRVFSQNT
jgi:hypothetical protein